MSDVETIMEKVQAGGTVTREEAEVVVRAVIRTCKGPVKPGKEAEFEELRRAVGSVVGGQDRGYDIGMLDALNRDFCGADFNDVIVKFPFDGKEHLEPCPKCGQMISFRSPYFPVSR